jgi:hypothetical protein
MADPPDGRHPQFSFAWSGFALLALLTLVVIGASLLPQLFRPASQSTGSGLPPGCVSHQQRTFNLPSLKGLNYGQPTTVSGGYLGTRWLRSGTPYEGGWEAARPQLDTDLNFIVSHGLGKLVRVFIGLDQLMVWNTSTGFVRFDDPGIEHFQEALDIFDAHHVKVIAVLFDQEVGSSPGNFHFEALDGRHQTMRANYLRAVDEFMRRFGSRSTIAAWDLFNEAYNSLGQEGGLPLPTSGSSSQVSPNYPDQVVRPWIQDLYRAAKCAVPDAWFTVSDTTELYWKNPPDPSRYDLALDFYDIHVYDDNPRPKDWSKYLHKPFIMGEVGGDINHGFNDQAVNSQVVGFWLQHARSLGVNAVLAHAAGGEIYSLRTGSLTPTGRVIQQSP